MKRVKEKIQFKLLTLCLLSLGEGIKGRGLFLFLLFFFSLPFGGGWGGASSFAQNYPIQITTQLVQPFSGFIPDYSTPGNQNLKLLVVFTDFTKPSYNIKLKLQITGQGITIQSKSYYYSGLITLQPGTPIEISGSDLSGLLNSANLDFSGITPQKYQTNSLPEGYYNICFTAYDYNNPIPIQVSNQSCAFGWMVLSDPPYLNLPICGSTTTVNTPQNMMFQWTAMNMNSPNSANTTLYDFDLYEVRPSTQSPGNIIQTLPPIYQVTTPFTFVNYGITEPQLYYGMQYVWRVRAREQSNRDLFKNQGYSQLCTFTYGSVLSQIDSNSIKLTLQGTALTYRVAKYTWDSLSIFLSYKLEYRKVGTPNWFPINTSLCRSLVNNLEPENTYEARVKGVFSEGDGPWSNVVTITTPAKPIIACGQSGIPPLAANFVPLTTGKTSQVWNIGQFDMLVTQLDNPNNPNGKYSGYGKIVIPFLLNMNLRGKFTNITVNEAMEVVEGRVEITTTGQSGPGIINLDTLITNISNAIDNIIGNLNSGNIDSASIADFNITMTTMLGSDSTLSSLQSSLDSIVQQLEDLTTTASISNTPLNDSEIQNVRNQLEDFKNQILTISQGGIVCQLDDNTNIEVVIDLDDWYIVKAFQIIDKYFVSTQNKKNIWPQVSTELILIIQNEPANYNTYFKNLPLDKFCEFLSLCELIWQDYFISSFISTNEYSSYKNAVVAETQEHQKAQKIISKGQYLRNKILGVEIIVQNLTDWFFTMVFAQYDYSTVDRVYKRRNIKIVSNPSNIPPQTFIPQITNKTTLHIFSGEVNKVGKATGVHHISAITGGSAKITGTETQGLNGVYKASVQVKNSVGQWVTKAQISTFFPKTWSKTKVLQEIEHAFQHKIFVGGNEWKALSSDGLIDIRMYLKSNNEIISSFPFMP
jgi:hypothetical protein